MGVQGPIPFILEGLDQGRLGVVRIVRRPGLPGGQVLDRRDGIVLEAQRLEEVEGLEKVFFPGHVGFILAERGRQVNEPGSGPSPARQFRMRARRVTPSRRSAGVA